jgi:hypothetical protein
MLAGMIMDKWPQLTWRFCKFEGRSGVRTALPQIEAGVRDTRPVVCEAR